MDTNLHFVITTVTGAKVTQDIKCPTEQSEAAINQILAQYSQIGLLKKDSGKFTLIPSSQIALVECDPQSSLLVEAVPGDVAKIASAANGLKRIK